MTSPAKNIAVIGCGYWGKNLVRNMAELGALAAVCDAYAPNAQAQSKQHNVPARSIDEVMADKTITGIVIAAPAAQHAALATQALNAGKHVFVEKPLALTVSDAEALEKLAAEKNRTLMVGHLLQYHPAYLKLKEMVTAGELGALTYVYSNRLSLGKFRTEENVLWSFAPHDISMVLGLFGEAPTNVSAQGTAHITPGIPDVVTTQFTFASGAKGHVFVSWLHPVKEQKLIVIGERAMAVFDDTLPMEQKLQLFRHKVEWNGTVPSPVKADAEMVPPPIGGRLGGGLRGTPPHHPDNAPLPSSPLRVEELSSEPLKNECQHFLDAMAGKTQLRTDAAEGIRVLKVLEAAEQSMSIGSPVNLNNNVPAGVYIHPTAIVDKGCDIGTGTKIWHFSHILGGTKIGESCVIGQNVMIGPDVTVGNRCKIQNNVSLYKGIQLEDGVFCGPSCVFTNVNTPRSEIERKDEYLPTKVGRAATIGANATIVCGNSLGAYCLIGAGAVITKDVKPHALMVGNPARQIGWVSHAGERLDDELTCPREHRKYRINAKEELEEILETPMLQQA